MSQPFAHRLRVTQLNAAGTTPVELAPTADERAAIAADLGLSALPALRFRGKLRAIETGAWELTGTLDARVVQPCVVTLAPVETALSEQVHRVYSPHVAVPESDEAEMPDADLEPLGQSIDVGAVLVESLALALPEYPRAPGATLDEPVADERDADETRRPFAGLAQLLSPKD